MKHAACGKATHDPRRTRRVDGELERDTTLDPLGLRRGGTACHRVDPRYCGRGAAGLKVVRTALLSVKERHPTAWGP